jgi:hypothetical protein
MCFQEMMLTGSQKRSEQRRPRAYRLLWLISFDKTISVGISDAT